MRYMIATVLAACLVSGAYAAENPIDPEKDISKLEEAEKVQKNLQDLKKNMQDAGYKDIKLTQALILQATDKTDKKVMLLLDPSSMTVVELRSTPETTGSGSEDDEED